MQLTDLESLLQFAMKKEREAADFFRLCGSKATDPVKQAQFEKMADEETGHYHKIQHFTSSAIAAGLLKSNISLNLSDYLAEVDFRPGMNYQELLFLAMKREERTIKLYTDLAGQTDRPEMVQMFRLLVGEELNHKKFLESESGINELQDM